MRSDKFKWAGKKIGSMIKKPLMLLGSVFFLYTGCNNFMGYEESEVITDIKTDTLIVQDSSSKQFKDAYDLKCQEIAILNDSMDYLSEKGKVDEETIKNLQTLPGKIDSLDNVILEMEENGIKKDLITQKVIDSLKEHHDLISDTILVFDTTKITVKDTIIDTIYVSKDLQPPNILLQDDNLNLLSKSLTSSKFMVYKDSSELVDLLRYSLNYYSEDSLVEKLEFTPIINNALSTMEIPFNINTRLNDSLKLLVIARDNSGNVRPFEKVFPITLDTNNIKGLFEGVYDNLDESSLFIGNGQNYNSYFTFNHPTMKGHSISLLKFDPNKNGLVGIPKKDFVMFDKAISDYKPKEVIDYVKSNIKESPILDSFGIGVDTISLGKFTYLSANVNFCDSLKITIYGEDTTTVKKPGGYLIHSFVPSLDDTNHFYRFELKAYSKDDEIYEQLIVPTNAPYPDTLKSLDMRDSVDVWFDNHYSGFKRISDLSYISSIDNSLKKIVGTTLYDFENGSKFLLTDRYLLSEEAEALGDFNLIHINKDYVAMSADEKFKNYFLSSVDDKKDLLHTEDNPLE